MPTRKAKAEWKGSLAEGSGRLKVGSGTFNGPYSWFEDGQAITPEELLGAAHAASFTIGLVAQFSLAGIRPTWVDTEANVTLRKLGPNLSNFAITKIELETSAEIPGIDNATFQKYALDAKQICPLSKALGGTEIQLNAKLVRGVDNRAEDQLDGARTDR